MKDIMMKLNDAELKVVNGGEVQTFSARCPNCGEWHDIGTWDPDNIIGINATVTVSCQCGTNFTVGFVM